ncbi:MAG: GNAT family N-acetyltransferase [Armatimonadetes bacterium]|nr:GNAT family N-acetyltransferase [Armatimonadota bacterium]
MVLDVRVYRDEDRDAVIGVVHQVYDEFGFGWEPDGYNKDVFDVPCHYGRDSFWVGEIDGGVVGCGALLTFEAIPGKAGTIVEHSGTQQIAGCDSELMRLFVLSSARRLGLGSALAQKIVDEATAAGCRSMQIWSDKVLHDAHKLYKRMGGVIVGERLCPPPDETPEWGMVLDLASV